MPKSRSFHDLLVASIVNDPNLESDVELLWIGLNDVDNEGAFVWADGNPMTWSNWDVGQPNIDRIHQDCVVLKSPRVDALWHDTACENNNSYVCETGESYYF